MTLKLILGSKDLISDGAAAGTRNVKQYYSSETHQRENIVKKPGSLAMVVKYTPGGSGEDSNTMGSIIMTRSASA